MGEGGVYGHPEVPVEPIRKVPWVKLEATDEHTYTPAIASGEQTGTVDERLQALGYAEGSP
jgi:hypothetical protein